MSTILLVDDDLDSLWPLRLVVEEQGHHVLLASEGEDALVKAARYLPDIIVTDWNMPKLDGVALCGRIRLYPALAKIAVVLTSSELPPEHLSNLWTAFMRKPLDLRAVEDCIGALLTRRLNAPQHRNPPIAYGRSWPALPAKDWT